MRCSAESEVAPESVVEEQTRGTEMKIKTARAQTIDFRKHFLRINVVRCCEAQRGLLVDRRDDARRRAEVTEIDENFNKKCGISRVPWGKSPKIVLLGSGMGLEWRFCKFL